MRQHAAMERRLVGFLAFDGMSALDLTGPLETFTTARREGGGENDACYETLIIGVAGRTIVSDSGVALRAQKTIATAPANIDTIVVPGGVGVRMAETTRKLSDWLIARAEKVRRIVAVCSGIYPLARAGLLDGRLVTTHWRSAQDVARRFPKLRVNQAAAFLKDGPFYTCGGGTAAIEMSLAIIEEDYGARVALAVARQLVMRLRPPGDNDVPVELADYQCAPTDRLAELPAWILANLQSNLSVDALAERASLCPRHFSRLFKRVFNSTPADFVEALRLDEARRRLSNARNSVDTVASAVGFKSADSFRRAFERRHGVTPSRFRNTLRTANPAPRAL